VTSYRALEKDEEVSVSGKQIGPCSGDSRRWQFTCFSNSFLVCGVTNANHEKCRIPVFPIRHPYFSVTLENLHHRYRLRSRRTSTTKLSSHEDHIVASRLPAHVQLLTIKISLQKTNPYTTTPSSL
jgi:hypothetical protein